MNALHHVTESHPVEALYRSVFQEATRRCWFQDVYRMEPTLETLLRFLQAAQLPAADLRQRRPQILSMADATGRVDFFDFIRTLRQWFREIHGGCASLVAKAAVGAMAREWPLHLDQETLGYVKGMAMHLAEGVAPRDQTEFHLACLMLRPRLEPGLVVLQTSTGLYGEIVECNSNLALWTPFAPNRKSEREDDPLNLLPLQPLVRGLPLHPEAAFPAVSPEDVWAECCSYISNLEA